MMDSASKTTEHDKSGSSSPTSNNTNAGPAASSSAKPSQDKKRDGSTTEHDGGRSSGQDSQQSGSVARWENASQGSPVQRYGSHSVLGPEDRVELASIATALSRRRSSVAAPSRPGTALGTIDEYDAALDPDSENFDLSQWLKHFVGQLQERGLSRRDISVAFLKLNVSGSGAALQLQQTVGSVLMAPLRAGEFLSFGQKEHKRILRDFEGLIPSGELLVVLGRPGSGCSTLLKILCGEMENLHLDSESSIYFNGIPIRQMQREFKGETVYNQEVDKHFPHLTVGQTLEFAASTRMPSHFSPDMSRSEFCRYAARVVMAAFGLSHTYNTKVGDDFVRGVSGGERKRVSIAEMVLAGSPMAAWDNSTRGLDSATALKFIQSLRMASDIGHQTNAVAIYQASQAIYDLFDKAVVLYEGRQIYFGPADQAKRFFEEQGWYCEPRQTTGDFLTSVTNPVERKPREGMEERVPRTADEFASYWRNSPEYQALQADLKAYEEEYLDEHQAETVAEFRQQKAFRQSKHARPKSVYLISIWTQIALNTKRAYQRIWGNITAPLTQSMSQLVTSLVVGSIFYGTPDATAGFYAKGSALFIAVLFNALTAISEISSMYDQRPIVEKHNSYAFYHPATEAMAGLAADIPIKFVTSAIFNIVLYFLAGLRREPAQFFLYFLINYMSIFVMSAIFRTLAAATKTVSQAMAFSGVIVLALIQYVGFTIRPDDMKDWFAWIRWINPIFYAYEILMANEFHGREFTCSNIFPPYTPPQGDSWICASVGAEAGRPTVRGDDFISVNYKYSYSHVWRNFGILWAFLLFFTGLYFVITELNSKMSNKAEVLVFQRNHVPQHLQKGGNNTASDGPESAGSGNEKKDVSEAKGLPPQKDLFTWQNVSYDIEVKGGTRRLLDNVSGWVKPGTLTALMGVSGAGKTTLLDVLAQRTSIGVITGDMLVNGSPLDASFQRKTGYVQQQDLHLETATVRESLQFSAMLRQPQTVSKHEKYEFVEEVIKMLNMEEFAGAVVGVPGEGLNVEQRKLLTIGVELAAKPKLLLFLDEPTSGLDSQSSWAICAFLRKLADAGQAVLCTIHQPSAILFQSFDRLLFLGKGGKTIYFGNIGENSRTLLDYFESHGARHCSDSENPAEYMLEVADAEDWHSVWNKSKEIEGVRAELERIHTEKKSAAGDRGGDDAGGEADGRDNASEFAMPFPTQLRVVSWRVLQQYWRMPGYIFAKFLLGIFAGLFISFSFFLTDSTVGGTQNVIFSAFMLTTIFTTLVQQIQPLFITQRSLYEVRERPSKAYSWVAFLLGNMFAEVPFQIMTGILIFGCFYYPIVGVQDSERQGLVLLFIIQLLIYASAFAHMTVASMHDAVTAGALVIILTIMSIMFNGVLQTSQALPGFWIFMYRVSPFTYWIGGVVATELAGRVIECAEKEASVFDPPANMTCGDYLAPLMGKAPGHLENPDAVSQCRYCPVNMSDELLANSGIMWSERWRNYGIMWAFIGFNLAATVVLYYYFRVRTGGGGLAKLVAKMKKSDKKGGS